MHSDIIAYHHKLQAEDQLICSFLFQTFNNRLPEAVSKVWHAHPVWFIEENPVVGYSRLKDGIRVLFWSGASFNEPQLKPGSGKFKDASVLYTDIAQINPDDLDRWLLKAREIQWDYKNIVKRKGALLRLK